MTDENVVSTLVARARQGDTAAVGDLCDRYADRVFRFVRSRVDSAEDAEDISQRVFLQMIQALPRYENRGMPFGAWLFRIARNAVIDHQRAHRVHETLDAVVDRLSWQASPEQQAVAASELDRVAAALEHLTDEQRDVIMLRFVAELSAGEIAAVLGRREGAIRALQFRALQALRRHLMPSDTPARAVPREATE